MTSFEWDTRCADVELGRLREGFTTYDHANFSRVLLENFARTQVYVHVITGSLKGSGVADVQRATNRRFQAEIRYGGTSTGVKNPVRYAPAEMFSGAPIAYVQQRSLETYGPRAAGDHNFMRPTQFIDDELIGPVSSFISRGRRTRHPERGV